MPGSIVEGLLDALPSAGIAGAVAMAFGMPFLPAFGAALVLGGLSHALAPKPPQQSQLGTPGGTSSLVSVRQPISYWQVIYGERKVGGSISFMQTTNGDLGEENALFHLVVTWAGHPCQEIVKLYADDEEITVNGDGSVSGRFSDSMSVYHSLGETSGQPFPSLVAYSAGKWTNDAHRQSGRTKTYVRMVFSPEKFPNGIPNFSAVIKGVCDIYDPRAASRGWSDNVALCVANYLENSKFGLAATLTDEVNMTQLEAAANDCDDAVALDAGGTEARYRLNMTFTTAEQPVDVLEAMTNAMAGRLAHIGDTWYVFAGVYEAPAVTLGEGDLAGSIRSQSLVSMQENANSVKGTFTDPSTWQPTDFPALVSSTYLAEDSEIQRWREMALDSTVTSGTQAQRLAKIELLRTRQGETFAAPFKLSALQVIAGGTFALTLAKYGYAAKTFECTSFAFAVTDGGELVVTLAGRETAAAIFDWSTSEEQAVDLAPNTNLPDPFTVSPAGAPVIAEAQYETLAGSGAKAKAVVTWAASPNAFAEQYQLRYKLASAADIEANWITRAPVRSTSETLFDLEPEVYDFAVRAINLYGVRSAWSTTRKEIFGLNVAPADLTGVSIQAAGGLALIRWDLHADLFVREGGWIEWRHSEAADASLAVWEESFSIGDAVPGNNNQSALPLKGGTYLGKARSQRGILSVNATKIATKQATILNFVNVSTLQEDSAFSGTHSNTAAPDSVLKLVATGLVDAIPDFDTISSLDSFGGIEGAGTYTFSAGLDLGSVQRVRLTSQLVGIISNVNDLIDQRALTIDDWVDFDGNAGASADAYIEVRETDNDPASSPSWSAWKRLDSAEFLARGFDFRVQLLTGDDSYNVALSQVRVAAAQIY